MLKLQEGKKKEKKNQIKCPLRRYLKIARELASLILLDSELKAKRPEFLKVRPPKNKICFIWVNISPLPSVIIVYIIVYFKIVF